MVRDVLGPARHVRGDLAGIGQVTAHSGSET